LLHWVKLTGVSASWARRRSRRPFECFRFGSGVISNCSYKYQTIYFLLSRQALYYTQHKKEMSRLFTFIFLKSLRLLLNTFFSLLYHPFAWCYDLIAHIISLGQWNSWIKSIIPFLNGKTILELGFGTGHLQEFLLNRDLNVFGLDESRQMAQISYNRLHRIYSFEKIAITRGSAGLLPFASQSFDNVVSTFPTPYIYQSATLNEIKRVLKKDGQIIVLLSAWITGNSIIEKLLKIIYKITGESFPDDHENMEKLLDLFSSSGLTSQVEWLTSPKSRLLVIIIKSKATSVEFLN
jgi:ubiquinone/menaquinone biosynthesis C-methylase UbiE